MDGNEEVGGVDEIVGGRVKELGNDCVRCNGISDEGGKDIAARVDCIGCVGVSVFTFDKIISPCIQEEGWWGDWTNQFSR